MRWWCAVLLMALGCEGWTYAQAPLMSPAMRGPLGYVQLQIVAGKLNLTMRQAVRTRQSSSSTGNDRRERMTVDMMGPHPAVDYELATSQSQLVLHVSDLASFRVARELRPGGMGIPFEFRQTPDGDIAFSWGEGDAQRQHRFSTIWHLLLVEPEMAKTHLVPILEFFRPGWNLATSVDRVTESLFAAADENRSVPRERWAQLVAQLSDSRYARREAADRQLRAESKAVLSYLEALNPQTLDFEQRHRIRGIRKSLTRGDDSDAPESIAAWLSSDARVWLALLHHADQQRRQTAAQQLGLILGEPVAYDAAAPLETRRQQIEALRKRVDSTSPPVDKSG